ncbi:hypothetical protein Ancab_000884 [Ancistrocladus abbreviatus]
MELKLSQEAIPQFQDGISLLLSGWSALQMAVDNEWGGPHSRSIALQFASDIFNWFNLSKELYIDDLEALLDDTMITLNTEAQDGSIEEIAEKLMIMHEECLGGNYGSIEKLREAVSRFVLFIMLNSLNEAVANWKDTPVQASLKLQMMMTT